MRAHAIFVLILASSLAFASEEGWPRKGDKVYVAATFKKLVVGVAGSYTYYDIPACAQLTIVKANVKKGWVTEDPMGGREHLQGTWLSRIHKAELECESKFAADGDPQVSRTGNKFTIDSK